MGTTPQHFHTIPTSCAILPCVGLYDPLEGRLESGICIYKSGVRIYKSEARIYKLGDL